MKKYIVPIIALLCLLLRAQNSEEYNLPLPQSVNTHVAKLRTALVEKNNVCEAIHGVLCGVWMMKWINMKTDLNLIPCPTERLLALSTLKEDGGHKEPVDVTTELAKLEYCIRLTCLQEIKRRSLLEFGGDENASCDSLSQWFTEKNNSPFDRIRSLQHRASSIAFTTMSMPRIWWTDRIHWKELLYKGDKIRVDQLHDMFSRNERDIIDLWEKKVLKGLPIHIQYSNLFDNLENKDVGYSFLTDPRNTCFSMPDMLGAAFMANETTKTCFGWMLDGKMVWNRAALKEWLSSYAEFQSHLLMRCEMLGGAPGRGTELTAMTFCNTTHRSQRNLVILGCHVSILRTYSKMSAVTGQDRLIPHAVDGITSDLMVQSLALARPFAQLAIHICYPQDRNLANLYRQYMFVNFDKPFTTEDLSRLMAKTSLPHTNVKLTINPWRHISIAFRRKLTNYSDDILDLDGHDTIDALQAGHSRATENRIYGLSPEALAGAAEDTLPLFLEVSTRWQLAMHTVPGGLGLSYKSASMAAFHLLAKSGQLGVEVQRSVSGQMEPHGLKLSEAKIAEYVLEKLDDTIGRSLETRLVNSLVCALTPMIKQTVSESLKRMETSSGNAGVISRPRQEDLIASEDLNLFNHHTQTATPGDVMNGADRQTSSYELYEDQLQPSHTSEANSSGDIGSGGEEEEEEEGMVYENALSWTASDEDLDAQSDEDEDEDEDENDTWPHLPTRMTDMFLKSTNNTHIPTTQQCKAYLYQKALS